MIPPISKNMRQMLIAGACIAILLIGHAIDRFGDFIGAIC